MVWIPKFKSSRTTTTTTTTTTPEKEEAWWDLRGGMRGRRREDGGGHTGSVEETTHGGDEIRWVVRRGRGTNERSRQHRPVVSRGDACFSVERDGKIDE